MDAQEALAIVKACRFNSRPLRKKVYLGRNSNTPKLATKKVQGPPTIEQYWRKRGFFYKDGALRGHYSKKLNVIGWNFSSLWACVDCGRISGGPLVHSRKVYASWRWHRTAWRLRRAQLWDEAHGDDERCDTCFIRTARFFFPFARDVFDKETEIERLEEQEDAEFYELKGIVDRFRRLLHTRVDKRAEVAAKLIGMRT